MKKVIILLFITLTFSACSAPTNAENVNNNNGLKRLVDEEAGVVCWFILTNGGIDCMPIEETKLKR